MKKNRKENKNKGLTSEPDTGDATEKRRLLKEKLKRQISSARDILTIYGDKNPDKHYRVVNTNKPGRVHQMERQGYEVVLDEDMVMGDSAIGENRDAGTAVTLSYKGETLVLMCIDKDIFDLRQEIKQEENDEIENEMNRELRAEGLIPNIQSGEGYAKRAL